LKPEEAWVKSRNSARKISVEFFAGRDRSKIGRFD